MTDEANWHIYLGNGSAHDGIDRLPEPPPWRRFSGEVLAAAESEEAMAGVSRPSDVDRGRNYLPEPEVVDLVNAALYLRRPLLVTGKPGTGKSTLAHSIAYELGLGPVLYWPVTSRSQLSEGLYRYDAIGRLQEANLPQSAAQHLQAPEIGRYLRLGPLGTALLARRRPRVLLIDELDKSDIDLPNDLLNVFEEGQFEIPELSRLATPDPVPVMTAGSGQPALIANGNVRCHAFPVVVVTSNGEREFPPAFLRRCIRITLQPPTAEKLARIVAVQLGADAAASGGPIIEEFARRRDTVDLATDQLLNALYLATSGHQPAKEVVDRVRQHLLQPLGTGGS